VTGKSSGHSQPIKLQSPTQEKHNLDLLAQTAVGRQTNTETEASDAVLAAHAQRQALAHDAQELRDEARAREEWGAREFVEVRRSRKRSAENAPGESPDKGAARVDARTDRELTETERRSSRTRKVSSSPPFIYSTGTFAMSIEVCLFANHLVVCADVVV
jgi:hypothetical protein